MAQNKSGQYWSKRFTKLEETLNGYGQDTYRQIEPAFNQAQREIQSKIDSWVVRVANNNQVSMTEAKRMLDAKELAEFRWNVKEYIKYGHDNELDAGWMKELENASARYHISRLEALKVQTQQAMEKAFGNELDELDSMSRKVYSEGYYHTAYELQKGFKVGWDIASIDSRKLERLISKPWAADGKNFSNRIWQSKTSMVNELHNELVRTCMLGKSPDEAIRHMTKFVDKKFKNAKMQAGRLVMTEQAFFASAAQKDAFTDLDVEEFEVVATLDSHTSEICQAMDGQHFPMKDYQPGVTAPPFHVWCRSTTVPYFDDEFNIGERAARGEDGKTYYVPDSMKYPEWKKTFVDGGSKEGLKPVEPGATIKLQRNTDSEIFKKIGEENYDGLHKILVDAPITEKAVWAKMENKLTVKSATANVHPCCHQTKGIEMNVTKDAKGSSWSKPYQTTFHEFGHNIDYLANVEYGNGYSFYPYSFTYQDNIFGKTLKQEINQRVDDVAATIKADFKAHGADIEWLHDKGYISDWNYDFYKQYGKWVGGVPKYSKSMAYNSIEKEIRAMDKMIMADLSDIVEGATNGKIKAGFGHGASYWKKAEHKLSTEAFAEMFDSSIANTEQLEAIKEYFPKSYEIFQQILESILKG